MNPVDFYLSHNSSLDQIELNTVEAEPSNKYYTDEVSEDNSLRFFGPVNIGRFALYRLKDGHLQIVSPFGSVAVAAAGVADGSLVELTALCSEGLVSGRVHATTSWRKGDGAAAPENALRATSLGDGRFEPLHTTLHARLQGQGLVEWAIVFLPDAHSSIKKNRQGGADILMPSGLIFELPKGKTADLVLAGKTQWAIPGEHGVFVLGQPPWLK